jgi:anti-anti-sigma factor
LANSNILIQNYSDVTVVTFQESSILDGHVIEQLEQDLYALTDKQHRQKLILDFSNVKFMASRTIGLILTLHNKAKGIKGEMVLCSIRKELMKVFKITNLEKLLKFFPDESAALSHFQVYVK